MFLQTGSVKEKKEDMWELKNAVMVRVDGETIKEDTWYTMVDGKVVEVDV